MVSQLKSGTLRGLVTTSPARVETLPDVPTLAETGLSKYEADIFYGVVAPAKTPPETLSQLAGWFSAALKAPEMKPKLAEQGLFPVGKCGAEFGAPFAHAVAPAPPRSYLQGTARLLSKRLLQPAQSM